MGHVIANRVAFAQVAFFAAAVIFEFLLGHFLALSGGVVGAAEWVFGFFLPAAGEKREGKGYNKRKFSHNLPFIKG
jgi:hypothetical protein